MWKFNADARVDQRRLAAALEVAGKAQHAFGDAQILGVADEGDGFE
jgi:hypothetical protein